MKLKTLKLDEYRGDGPTQWRCGLSRRRRRQINLGALERAEFRCERCGADERLTIHHATRIKGQRDEREVLCVQCHLAEHGRVA